ncbi:hypothetical protein ACQ4PT_002728 [Festuca glaucescens]
MSARRLEYYSLLDAQLDAVFTAIEKVASGMSGAVRVVVSETGWPSKGDAKEVGAGVDQREPEARGHLRAQLRRLLPQPEAGLQRPVRPRWQGRRRQRRPRVAGQRPEECGTKRRC